MRITELIIVTISVPPQETQRVLDLLAGLSTAVNPELRYELWQTHIEFPAWRCWLGALHEIIGREAFVSARMRYRLAVPSASLSSGEPCRTLL